jgi:hypothetical protein
MYLTEGGKLSYSWSVSPGGTIISGWGTKSVWIHWDAAGTQTVTVDYITPTGCPVLNPTTKTVEVRPLPVPSLNGPTTPCINITYMYSTESGMKNYNWSISPGGQIVSGFHSYQVLVKWTLPGARWLKIYYETPYYCKPLIPTKLDIMAVVCASNLSPGTGTPEIDTLPGSDDSQNITHIITKDGSELSFMLFPNPTEGHFTLQVVTSRAEILNLSIFNIEGKEIYWAPQIQVIGKSDLDIDLSGFPNGIYAVILKNRDQQALKKLILRK